MGVQVVVVIVSIVVVVVVVVAVLVLHAVVIGEEHLSPVQMLLSRPEMVKPTSQVQRVEPRK